MPIATTYEEQGNIRVHIVTGTVVAEDFIKELSEIWSNEEFPRHANVVWDLEGADVSQVTRNQVRQLAAFVQSSAEEKPEYRVAFIAGSELTFGMARMYEQLQNLFIEDSVCIFRSSEAAWKWIREQDG